MDKSKDTVKQTDIIADKNSLLLAMKDMERSRERMLRTQQIAGIGGFEYLPEDRVIILSPEACTVMGLSQSKTIYTIDEFCKRIRKGVHDSFCVMLEEASDQNQDGVKEFIFKDDSRHNRFIEVFMETPEKTLKGSISGVFHNITNRKQAEIARSVNQQAFETVFSNAKIAILVLNLKGEIIGSNGSAAKLFGYTAEEMNKMHSVTLLVEDDIMDAARIFARFINSAGRYNFLEYRLKKRSGEIFDVLVNFEMIIDSEGEKIYIFINDISGMKDMERKNLDQERMLIQQTKMATLGEMVALIAHQWQQPINSIAMIVQMLEELIEVDDKNKKMLQKSVDSVMAQVMFMSNTMNDFRNFLKPSSVKENFNVFRVVKEVVNLYRPQLKFYQMNCDVNVVSDAVRKATVFGFENELKNVLLNFLTNSRDAIESNKTKNGDIHIVLSLTGNKVHICIEDNGGGIDQEIMKNIFNPYVTSKGDSGTGLGLYMAKLIIKERMGGDILLKNTEKGLRITVILDNTSDDM